MQRLVRSALALCAAVLFMASAYAQDNITLLPRTDLPGFDYEVLKDVTLDTCQSACTEDRLCRAFTFNESAGWCFLKGDVGPETAFEGATSGRIDLVGFQTTEAVRRAELPFPADGLIEGAKSFAQQLPQTDPPPPNLSYADLVASGDEAVAQANPASAVISYRYALAINHNDPALWMKLA